MNRSLVHTELKVSVVVVKMARRLCLGCLREETWVIPRSYQTVKQQHYKALSRARLMLKSVIYSDGWEGDNGLVDFGYKKHLRVHHGKNAFVRGNFNINGIESFQGYAKTRLVKFKGMNSNMFELHPIECEICRKESLNQLRPLINLMKMEK